MEKMTNQEKHFLNILESQQKQKISINLSKETVQKIDFLAKSFNITRTVVLESLTMYGLTPYLNMVESVMRKVKAEEPKRKEPDQILKKLNEFKKKWKGRYYS